MSRPRYALCSECANKVPAVTYAFSRKPTRHNPCLHCRTTIFEPTLTRDTIAAQIARAAFAPDLGEPRIAWADHRIPRRRGWRVSIGDRTIGLARSLDELHRLIASAVSGPGRRGAAGAT